MIFDRALIRIFYVATWCYFISNSIIAQTFDGQPNMPFPPTGTTGMTSSIASVSGVGILGGCKQIEKVTIDLNHTFDGDIALFLICPDGTFLELSSANGGAGDNYKVTVFRDDAGSNVISGVPPYNGDFRPEGRQNTNLLNPYPNTNAAGTFTLQNTFSGKNADGDWTLFLNDWVPADVGLLNSWSITFSTASNLDIDLSASNIPCPGNPVTISSIITPAGSYNYNWSSDNGTPFTGQSTSTIISSPMSITTYTVTVTDASGLCSDTESITVNVSSGPLSGDVDINALPDEICVGQSTTLTFTNTVSNNWVYNIQATGSSSSTNFNVNVFGVSGTVVVSPTETTTYSVISVTDQATGCTFILPSPISTIVNVLSTIPVFSFNNLPDICEGTTIDLYDYVNVFNGTIVTFHSDSPANASNEINSIVTPLNTTTYTLLFSNGPCILESDLTIEVLPSGNDPVFADASICLTQTINLTTLITPSTAGSFSGPHVSGSNFNASVVGEFTITFNPASICYNAVNAVITVIEVTTPDLLEGIMCFGQSAPLDLTTLEDPNFNSGVWSGVGVSGNTFTPNSAGVFNVMFTSSEACTTQANTQITVDIPEQAAILPLPPLCQDDPIVNLNDLIINGVIGTWNGPGVNGNQFDPSSVSGNIIIEFTPNALCHQVSAVNINVYEVTTPDMSGAEVCKTNTAFDLTTLEDPAFAGGTWSGQGVNGNTFSAVNLSGEIDLQFQSDIPCALPITITLNIVEPSTPDLGSANLCSSQGLYDLNNLLDPLYTSGTWNGIGVTSNFFDPSVSTGIIPITFTSTLSCINTATTNIIVESAQTPSIASTTICNTIPSLDLTTLESSNFANGTWSGQGVSGNLFFTSNLSGPVTLTYVAMGCVLPVTNIVTVQIPQTPILMTDSICVNASPLNLSALVEPIYSMGTWSGNGVTNNLFNPQGQTGNIALSFISDVTCTNQATTSLEVLTIPIVNNIDVICDAARENYTVTFNISGGDANTYLVNGLPSSSNFASNLFSSASNYTFDIQDGNGCAILNIQGSKNCACTTNAGTMQVASPTANICKDAIYTASHNGDQVLDNDNFVFVLHDNAGPSLGNIFGISNTPTFGFPTNGELGKTYYISAVAGNADGTFVDLNDGCLSVAAGSPIQFYEIQFSASIDDKICIDETFKLTTSGTGDFPITAILQYNNGSKILYDTISIASFNAELAFYPSDINITIGQWNVNVVSIQDAQCQRNTISNVGQLVIQPRRSNTIQQTLCKGEKIIVNGNEYNELNPNGQEIITSTAAGQCDSIINVSLTFAQEAVGIFAPQACKGKKFVINGTTYDENNASGSEVLKNASSLGCDSTIQIKINYKDQWNVKIDTTICYGKTIIINGQQYNSSQLTGTSTLLSVDGCDSIVDVQAIILPDAVRNIDTILCKGNSIIIQGKIFNEINTVGTISLSNASYAGCDSTINIKVSFYPERIDTIRKEINEVDSFVFKGIVFNASKTSGLVSLGIPAVSGCDSSVFILLNVIYSQFELVDIKTEKEKCPNGNNGAIVIQQIVGCPIEKLTIDGAIFTIDQYPYKIENLKPGQYIIDIEGKFGCTYVDTIIVEEAESLTTFKVNKQKVEAYLGEGTNTDLVITPNPTSISWQPDTYLSCNDCISPQMLGPMDSLTYSLTMWDDNGCPQFATLFLKINKVKKDILIPNVLYLSSSIGNNIWNIYGTSDYELYEVAIYDRWGSLVFFDDHSLIDGCTWDGKLNGNHLLPGVYVYSIKAIDTEDGQIKIFVGDVTIVR